MVTIGVGNAGLGNGSGKKQEIIERANIFFPGCSRMSQYCNRALLEATFRRVPRHSPAWQILIDRVLRGNARRFK